MQLHANYIGGPQDGQMEAVHVAALEPIPATREWVKLRPLSVAEIGLTSPSYDAAIADEKDVYDLVGTRNICGVAYAVYVYRDDSN